MTGDGMFGVFTPDSVLAGWWRSQWRASDRKWAGSCITGCGRGRYISESVGGITVVYWVGSLQCTGWDHCTVLGGCLFFLSLCSGGLQDLLRLKPPSLLRQWSLAFHSLLHQPARTLSAINTPHIPSSVILHPPAYENGTDRRLRNVGYQQCDAGNYPKENTLHHLYCFTAF